MRHAALTWSVCLALLHLSVSANAGTFIQRGLQKPIQILVEGYVGAKPANLVPEVSWIVGCLGKTYALHVSRLLVLTGDVSPFNIENAVEPYRTNFYLQGHEAALNRFASTPPGEKIVLIGFLIGAQQLVIGRIGAAEVPTPTPE
jgi:hypothetical protein